MPTNFPDDTAAVSLADADRFIVADASDSNNAKSVTFSGLKSSLIRRTEAEAAAGIAEYSDSPLNSIGDITDPQYQPGDVRRYGAAGDGVTDDYAAFAAALAQNEEDGGAPIRSYQNTHYLTQALSWCEGGQDRKTWHADNTLLITDQDINGIQIGGDAASTESQELQILGHLSYRNSLGHATSTGVGFKFQSLHSGRFHIGFEGWEEGYNCSPATGGCYFNDFYLYRAKNCNYLYRYKPEDANGFVNENTHHGGSWSLTGSDSPTFVCMIYNGGNNNVFVRPSLETAGNGTVTAAYWDAGFFNKLEHPRLELDGVTFTVNKIWLDENCRSPRLDGGYNMRLSYITDHSDRTQQFLNDALILHAHASGVADGEVLKMSRHSRNEEGYPLAQLRDLFKGSADNIQSGLQIANAGFGAGFLLDLQRLGSVREASDGNNYLCIQSHTTAGSAATANTGEPGTCTGWEAYWERLPARWQSPSGAASSGELGAPVWATSDAVAASVSYFKVNNSGHILTNQYAATASVGSQNGRMPIYDEDGTLLGYIPIYDAS